MKKLPCFVLVIGLALSLYSVAQAQTAIKSQKVSVFKNASGFFVKTIEANMSDKTVRVTDLPVASLGSLWFSCADNTMRSIKSLNKEVDAEVPVGGKWPSMIAANTGKTIKLTLHDGTNYEGKIESVTEDIVYLSNAQGWSAINAANCKHVVFTTAPKLSTTIKNIARIFEIDFEKAVPKQQVEMMYLQSNISWLPMYKVTLLDDTRARINLSANLVNDAEDLINADVNLVVGVPNFSHARYASPLVSGRDATSLLYDLTTSNNNAMYYERRSMQQMQSFSNAVMSEADDAETGELSAVVGTDNADGDTQEDLFFYRLEKLSLPKGGRSHTTLFEAEVPYKHLYEVSLPSNVFNNYGIVNDPSSKQPNRVWHSIELQNKTNYPWTTGPALVLKGSDPLSQDVSKYTAKNGRSLIKITVSPDIIVKDNDEQISREAGPKVRGRTYDMLLIEGTIEIKNNKEKEIELDLTRTVTGVPKTTSIDWKMSKKPNPSEVQNPYNYINWTVKLAAGEEKKITYQYTVYIQTSKY